MNAKREWTLLMIGGSSQTGKSWLGQALAHRFDIAYIDADLFWITLQRAMPDEPLMHAFDDEASWNEPVEVLVERYLAVSHFVCNALESVVAHHDILGRPSVMEGVWLLPAYGLQGVYAGHRLNGTVRGLFLYEGDPESSRYVSAADKSFLAKPKHVREAQIACTTPTGSRSSAKPKRSGCPSWSVARSRPWSRVR
jgi:2-phosphoglycerate kinase